MKVEDEVEKGREDDMGYNNSREMGVGIESTRYKGVCCHGVW